METETITVLVMAIMEMEMARMVAIQMATAMVPPQQQSIPMEVEAMALEVAEATYRSAAKLQHQATALVAAVLVVAVIQHQAASIHQQAAAVVILHQQAAEVIQRLHHQQLQQILVKTLAP